MELGKFGFDEEPEISILSKVEYMVVVVVVGRFKPNVWLLLVLMEMRIRIEIKLLQYFSMVRCLMCYLLGAKILR